MIYCKELINSLNKLEYLLVSLYSQFAMAMHTFSAGIKKMFAKSTIH